MEAHATRVLSPRKLGPRLEAVALHLLAFFALASAHLVAHAETERTRDGATLSRQHDEAQPVDALSAAEPETETDATLDVLPSCLTTRVAPIERFARAAVRVALASERRAQTIRSAVMAQGPPRTPIS